MRHVVLSGAKNLFFLQSGCRNEKRILRFARDDEKFFDGVSIAGVIVRRVA
ncbi:hypothetical protein [Thermomonas carbonis]|uniref:Uncharacterized protein n=1 Tax=Thermomonas carbonis TaxID=1463158 RepID=A0A7G9SS40_9GAMM|nr:hypothetical protein [Thermomonas carbonis]QNN70665.1 hypothetical protein H9L16_03370 [Thermomonas carbonis]